MFFKIVRLNSFLKLIKIYLMEKKKKKIIFGAIFFIIFLFLIFFSFSKNGEIRRIEISELESMKKPPDIKEVSPFSGVSCKNYKNRAFGAVLAQYPETMPLSSPSSADIVIEAPVANAGGITRLVAIFQCNEPKEIGSIRSVRPFMVDLSLGYDVIFSSWGGCESAISRIKKTGLSWFDARTNPYGIFFRKRNIPAPHNGFTSFEGLKKAAKNSKFRNSNEFEGYHFFEKEEINFKKEEQEINITDYLYPVKYVYNSKSGNYFRFWNGQKMIDRNTGKQVFAKNVVVMKTKIKTLSPGVADIKVSGSGDAIIWRAGEKIIGTWSKKDAKSKLVFLDKNKKEIKFIPGSLWIHIVSKF